MLRFEQLQANHFLQISRRYQTAGEGFAQGMSGHTNSRPGVVRTLIDNSFLLIAGAVIALIWANVDHEAATTTYHDFVHFDITTLWSDSSAESHQMESAGEHLATDEAAVGQAEHGAEAEHAQSHGLTIHFIINDILMALFFAIAAKEVWESLLPGGALSNPRKAATPLLATLGGIAGPALVYLGGAALVGGDAFQTFGKGWAIPCATDIAFSYLIARFIFGATHPAIAFLLLLAIADDAAGLIILAIFYPQAPIVPAWLLLTVGAVLLALLFRRWKVQAHWAYLIGPGVLSWASFYLANIHPALGLVPIIPAMPHAHTDLGIFAREELDRHDTLNEFEHFWKLPVELFLGLFGLANAGVVLSSLGTGTWLVLAGLLVGKPLGITLLTFLAEKGFKLEKPTGMDYRHIVTLGMVAGIGFTVALFVSVAAFPVAGPVQDSVKMGALLSFAAAPFAILIGKSLGIRPLKTVEEDDAAPSAHAAA